MAVRPEEVVARIRATEEQNDAEYADMLERKIDKKLKGITEYGDDPARFKITLSGEEYTKPPSDTVKNEIARRFRENGWRDAELQWKKEESYVAFDPHDGESWTTYIIIVTLYRMREDEV